jgi:hypothetical protein
MLARDEARRVPQAQEREWAQYERRNPGTAHPDRVRAQIARGLQARADDWDQGTARFQRTSSSVAEAGRRARSQQRRPVTDPGHWDDDDPDLMEAPTMHDGGPFRAGYRHAGYIR